MTNFFLNEEYDQGFNDMSQNNPVNRSQIKIRIQTVGMGNGFIVASDDQGDCYSWGVNSEG